MPIRVDSEIGRLRRVLVHRPGREIDWMVPAMMESLLFDDILDGDEAREEHDLFSRVLRQAGVEVLDAQDLLADVLAKHEPPRKRLLDELEAEYGVPFSLVRRLDELPPGAGRGPDRGHPRSGRDVRRRPPAVLRAQPGAQLLLPARSRRW